MLAISLPKTYCSMAKFGSIIKIGNSKGLIIPSSILKELSLEEKDEVMLNIENGLLCVKKIEEYKGPFTGIFSDLPRPEPGEPDPWGDKSGAETVEEWRSGRYDRNKELDW